jgi:two-component system OmpR family response regulator/two-component system response regulator QseB
MRVLLVEDDPLLGDGLQAGLRQQGFATDWLKDGMAADTALLAQDYGAVVLDLGLPRLSGIDLLRRLRGRGSPVPVLILTARDAVENRIAGLDAGADDYVVKPVDLGELAARLRALVRRAAGAATPTLSVGDTTLDLAARAVTCRGKAVALSTREFDILRELMQSAGRVLSREQIEERLYAWGDEVGSNTVEVHIHHLRKKLYPELIRTVRGVGYLVQKDKG